jgi:hypothetical protein
MYRHSVHFSLAKSILYFLENICTSLILFASQQFITSPIEQDIYEDHVTFIGWLDHTETKDCIKLVG